MVVLEAFKKIKRRSLIMMDLEVILTSADLTLCVMDEVKFWLLIKMRTADIDHHM